jgi:uncharacterized protein
MNIDRHLEQQVAAHFEKYKQVLVVLGSRQVGKTTLVKRLFPNADYLLVDNEPVRKIMDSYDIETYKLLIRNTATELIIDEVHLLENPGRAIKIIYDQMPSLKIIITGSSSFHIKNKTGESLAGRKIDYLMYPLTFSEYLAQKGIEPGLNFNLLENALRNSPEPNDKMYRFDMDAILENCLIYGQYPALIDLPNDKKYLQNFADSLIFKDLLELHLIENKALAANLLKLLAFQIGNLINYSELALRLSADQRVIKRYIDIFEQSFILFRLYPYSKNRRDEIVKSPKIFFYDTGLRNALIGDFSSLESRLDKGHLFENFVISELIKQNSYQNAGLCFYYWRTKQGSEIDVVIKNDARLTGIEVKWRKTAANKAFLNHYPEAGFKIITTRNFY